MTFDRTKLVRQFTVADEDDFIPTGCEHRLVEQPALRLPFGFCNGKWEAMKAQMQPGDELWEFRSSPDTWVALCGRAGVVLLRDDEVIASIVTSMS